MIDVYVFMESQKENSFFDLNKVSLNQTNFLIVFLFELKK